MFSRHWWRQSEMWPRFLQATFRTWQGDQPSLAHFLILYQVFLGNLCSNVLSIFQIGHSSSLLDTGTLSAVWFASIFSHSVVCLFFLCHAEACKFDQVLRAKSYFIFLKESSLFQPQTPPWIFELFFYSKTSVFHVSTWGTLIFLLMLLVYISPFA